MLQGADEGRAVRAISTHTRIITRCLVGLRPKGWLYLTEQLRPVQAVRPCHTAMPLNSLSFL
jgi:hypothetical protein